jgi:hypothetical protein
MSAILALLYSASNDRACGGPTIGSCTAGTGPAPLSVMHPVLTTPNVFGSTDLPPTPFAYSTTLRRAPGE